jgi:hypothetical protein
LAFVGQSPVIVVGGAAVAIDLAACPSALRHDGTRVGRPIPRSLERELGCKFFLTLIRSLGPPGITTHLRVDRVDPAAVL